MTSAREDHLTFIREAREGAPPAFVPRYDAAHDRYSAMTDEEYDLMQLGLEERDAKRRSDHR